MRLLKRVRWRLAFHRVAMLQLRTGRPPEVRVTYARLRGLGVSRWRAWRLLAAAYESEVAAMMLQERVYDHAEYVRVRLTPLPDGGTAPGHE